MARLARIVVPFHPHHVTQRGNRRQAVFFMESDYRMYIDLMAEWCGRCRVAVWAYCLMPNHVHLVAIPSDASGLARAVGEAHRRYTRAVNFRHDWKGYLWQGRFSSVVMDEQHLLAAARYTELNPVRAGLVTQPGAYPWSSAQAHLQAQSDRLVNVEPLLNRVADWEQFLAQPSDRMTGEAFRKHERTGRPLGNDAFVRALEKKLDRSLRPRRPGPKKMAA